MSNQVKLSARLRSENGRNAVKQVRARRGVPAIIYGSKQQPQGLEIAHKDIDRILSRAIGENLLVDLQIDENGKTVNRLALIQEVQHHPVKGVILHVDFHAVSADEKLTTEVPVEPTGEADGVKNFGGLLEQNLRALEIECFPKDLPEVIEVDISALKIGDSIHVKDITLPAGVTAVTDENLTIFHVVEPNVAEPEATPAAAAATQPEVIKEKKVEGEA
ncbi:MAG: 50S ribosomal protein L25/general stress protein Ctc, partial [Chthoniobacterales bacterium]